MQSETPLKDTPPDTPPTKTKIRDLFILPSISVAHDYPLSKEHTFVLDARMERLCGIIDSNCHRYRKIYLILKNPIAKRFIYWINKWLGVENVEVIELNNCNSPETEQDVYPYNSLAAIGRCFIQRKVDDYLNHPFDIEVFCYTNLEHSLIREVLKQNAKTKFEYTDEVLKTVNYLNTKEGASKFFKSLSSIPSTYPISII